MFNAISNISKIPDLRRKVMITLGMIAVYRVGSFIPTPGVDGARLAQFFAAMEQTTGGTLFGMMNLFAGGAMERMTIFAIGIMPYISASIILQLLTAVIPQLERLARQGEEGRKAITQYTRYFTVVLALVQSFFIAVWLFNPENFDGMRMVQLGRWQFYILTVITLTTGTAFLMWLGEQIQEKGIGNGISLIITASILSRLPAAVAQLILLVRPGTTGQAQIDPLTVLFLIFMFVVVVVAVVLLTQGVRKIPVQYARRVVGRKIYGGQSTHIPLKVNQSGVIPIIFAQSIIMFPATIAGFVGNDTLQGVASALMMGRPLYYVTYVLLILFFCYFYAAITFNPTEMAHSMKRFGGFIPGIRPGRQTAEYLDFIMTRITLPGAIALATIAVLPSVINSQLGIPFLVSSFFGGMGILIIVGVMLDTMRQVESHMLMRHYEGFMKKGRVKGRLS